MFIAFDGIDGAGKNTIYENIANYLSKYYDVQVFDMGKLGFLDDIINNIKNGEYLCSSEIRECIYYFEGVLFSNNIAQKYINDPEKHILIDRYILSYMSYGPLNGMNINRIHKLCKNMVWPDYYFYIDTFPETALQRIAAYRNIDKPEIGYKNSIVSDEEKNRKRFIEYQTNVRNNFLQAIKNSSHLIHLIDNNGTVNQSIDTVKEILSF